MKTYCINIASRELQNQQPWLLCEYLWHVRGIQLDSGKVKLNVSETRQIDNNVKDVVPTEQGCME